ncbi:MAG: HAD family hydrolase [Clostridiales bacterium]|nr:HAD family hydrolase [Clostridiales bacterium]
MQYKAVIFDLFETLITEWGHKKYTKNEMCSDLGIDRVDFDIYWNEKETERYTGDISFSDSIRYVCEKCGRQIDEPLLSAITEKRIKTKSVCFEYVAPDVYQLLDKLKAMGLRLAIISNCSSEEVTVIKQSKLYEYFEQVILSYEVGIQKPDKCIYEKTADLLSIAPEECIFAGDGGSNELEGAMSAGMKAVQVKWYTNQLPHRRDSIAGLLTAERPLDILRYI